MRQTAGAPLEVTEDLLTTFNISLVARGTVSETGAGDDAAHSRYAVPKQRGIMRCAIPQRLSLQPPVPLY